MLLHIKWSHVQAIMRHVWRCVRWVLAAFHLTMPGNYNRVQDNEQPESDQDEDTETDKEDGEEDEQPALKRATKKRATRAISAVAAVRSGISMADYPLPDPKFLEKSIDKYKVL